MNLNNLRKWLSDDAAGAMSGEEGAGGEEPVFIKKTVKRPQTLRKRPRDDDADENIAQVVRRAPTEDAPLPEETPGVSKIEKLDILYSASGSAVPSSLEQSTAVASADYDTSVEVDRERIAKRLAATKARTAGEDTEYRGQAAYRSFITLHDTARANANSTKFRVAGPVRAASHIRMTCRFDYAPDLCKDYNETGFCGFGDSCKFVHDRGDYKSGWELEQEWEEARAKDQARMLGEADNEGQLPARTEPERPVGPPELCPICEEAFKKPIVITACQHYFCERCALKHDKQSKLCHVCRSPVNGQFKVYRPPVDKI